MTYDEASLRELLLIVRRAGRVGVTTREVKRTGDRRSTRKALRALHAVNLVRPVNRDGRVHYVGCAPLPEGDGPAVSAAARKLREVRA